MKPKEALEDRPPTPWEARYCVSWSQEASVVRLGRLDVVCFGCCVLTEASCCVVTKLVVVCLGRLVASVA